MENDAAPKGTVLIIDDDDFVRAMVTKLVKSFGYAPIGARDGFEALDILSRMEAPAVVITDIVMPKMDGLEMLRQLRAKYPQLKIIAMSGGGRSEQGDYLELARKSGANEIVSKPINPRQLRDILQQLAQVK